MTPVLTIESVEFQEQKDRLTWSARLIIPNGEDFVLWYRVSPEFRGWVCTDRSDGFLVPALLYAMQNRWDLQVRGEVSPGLVRRLYEYQHVWACWRPEVYSRVNINAKEAATCPPKGTNLITTFSGGLDSCFTVWNNLAENRLGRVERLDAALLVHGMDIPLAQTDIFNRAAKKNRELLEPLGITLITCATNFRDLPLAWEDAHGTALAGCLHVFSGKHGAALIPSSHCYNALRMAWGSTPIADPLLSSNALDIRYDGAGWMRPEKSAAVANWPDAMRLMRVCWEGPELDRNCGHCSKCVSTALGFAAQNLPVPPALAIGNLARAVHALSTKLLDPPQQLRVQELLDLAARHQVHADWVRELEGWLRNSQSPPAPPRHRWQNFWRRRK